MRYCIEKPDADNSDGWFFSFDIWQGGGWKPLSVKNNHSTKCDIGSQTSMKTFVASSFAFFRKKQRFLKTNSISWISEQLLTLEKILLEFLCNILYKCGQQAQQREPQTTTA
jgi:hypothetical protein